MSRWCATGAVREGHSTARLRQASQPPKRRPGVCLAALRPEGERALGLRCNRQREGFAPRFALTPMRRRRRGARDRVQTRCRRRASRHPAWPRRRTAEDVGGERAVQQRLVQTRARQAAHRLGRVSGRLVRLRDPRRRRLAPATLRPKPAAGPAKHGGLSRACITGRITVRSAHRRRDVRPHARAADGARACRASGAAAAPGRRRRREPSRRGPSGSSPSDSARARCACRAFGWNDEPIAIPCE